MIPAGSGSAAGVSTGGVMNAGFAKSKRSSSGSAFASRARERRQLELVSMKRVMLV